MVLALVSRQGGYVVWRMCSLFAQVLMLAGWQNGYAEDCKSFDIGSIPVPASSYYSDLAQR